MGLVWLLFEMDLAAERDVAAVAGAKLRSRVVAVTVIAHRPTATVTAVLIDSAGRGECRGGEGDNGEQCEESAFHCRIISPFGF